LIWLEKLQESWGYRSAKEWRNYSKNNLDLFIPATADRVYKEKRMDKLGRFSWI
jgi:hypothetical protein